MMFADHRDSAVVVLTHVFLDVSEFLYRLRTFTIHRRTNGLFHHLNLYSWDRFPLDIKEGKPAASNRVYGIYPTFFYTS